MHLPRQLDVRQAPIPLERLQDRSIRFVTFRWGLRGLARLSSKEEQHLKNLMKDAKGTVIYVGKAKDLRARVRQYFRGQVL